MQSATAKHGIQSRSGATTDSTVRERTRFNMSVWVQFEMVAMFVADNGLSSAQPIRAIDMSLGAPCFPLLRRFFSIGSVSPSGNGSPILFRSGWLTERCPHSPMRVSSSHGGSYTITTSRCLLGNIGFLTWESLRFIADFTAELRLEYEKRG